MSQTSRGFWSRLSSIQRIGLIGAALILPCCGGLTAYGALSGSGAPESAVTEVPVAERVTATSPPASSLSPASASPSPASPSPASSVATVKVTKAVGFSTKTVEDDELDEGTTRVRTKGMNGVRTLTYRVTYVNGAETGRTLVSAVVTRKPVTKVVAVGTKTGASCAPGYDPCVPVASDVDCAGGGGNGPAYVDGPIRVTGDDPYDLDRDGDGIACDG